jgi:hypothetical protein
MLLNALLGISAARSWLSPTLMVMRLHAYVTQALLPGKTVAPQAQLPGFDGDADVSEGKDLASFISRLEDEGDIRITEARKAVEGWSRLDVVDMSFKGSFSIVIINLVLIPFQLLVNAWSHRHPSFFSLLNCVFAGHFKATHPRLLLKNLPRPSGRTGRKTTNF